MTTITKGWPFPRINAAGTKHELTTKQVQTYMGDFLEKGLRDLAAILLGRSGILPQGTSPLTLAASVLNDKITISDGLGLIYDPLSSGIPLVDWVSTGAIQVANTAGKTYRVGLRLQTVPLNTTDGIRQNARTLEQIQYVVVQRAIGELGHPDSVTDLGNGRISLDVSTLMRAGGDLEDAGTRAVRVWLATPVDPNAAVAFVNSAIAYNAGAYETVGFQTDCGQHDRKGVTSTNPADYWVLIQGPTVTTADLSADAHYLYLGSFAGAGPGAPIGAVSTVGVYRFESTIGTLAANVLQLAKDLYTAPSLDGDGVANLATPIETQVAALTVESNRQRYRTPIAQGVFRLGNSAGVNTQLIEGYGWDAGTPIACTGAGRFEIKLAANPAGAWEKLCLHLSASGHSGSFNYAQVTEDFSVRNSGGNKTFQLLYHGAGGALDPDDGDANAARIFMSVFDTDSAT